MNFAGLASGAQQTYRGSIFKPISFENAVSPRVQLTRATKGRDGQLFSFFHDYCAEWCETLPCLTRSVRLTH